MAIKIHRWTTPGLGSVNSYWIESADGVIVVDGQRELSKARRVLEEIEGCGKPIVAVFLTHPHPDHFGGIGLFAAAGSGVPVYGSRTTRESMEEDRFGLVKASHEVVGDDFPKQVTLPDRIIEDGEELTLTGVRVRVHELGLGEAECMTVLSLPEEHVFFCADAIQHGMTPFLLEGRSGEWLKQLERLRALTREAKMVYPGHGEPGPPEALIAEQARYLQSFRTLVAHALRQGEPGEGFGERIAAAMDSEYHGYEPVAAIPDLLVKNAAPVAEELGGG